MKKIFALLCFAWTSSWAISQEMVFDLYFAMDASAITATHSQKIDSVFSVLPADKASYVTVTGFTDFVGSSGYNRQLSANRAQAITDFLFSTYGDRISEVVQQGLGELDSTRTAPLEIGVREHRKVRIVVSRKEAGTTHEEVREKPVNIKPISDSSKLIEIRPVSTSRMVGLENLISDSLQVGAIVILDDLNFYAGRHVLLRESIPHLKELLLTLRQNPNLHIRIEGHICCGVEGEPDGYDQDTGEQRLSYNRAHNIYQYLVRNGIDKNRLSFAGFGYSRPIYYPEKNREEQRKNRRVEIIVTKL